MYIFYDTRPLRAFLGNFGQELLDSNVIDALMRYLTFLLCLKSVEHFTSSWHWHLRGLATCLVRARNAQSVGKYQDILVRV